MTFLKPIMLAGLGAVVIPLVLHLLSKSRYRNVEWGAMMFLQPETQRLRDNGRLKQALLLTLRVGVILALAIALARPVLQARSPATGEDARVHAIIILDRSASMGLPDGARTRLASARQAVVNILSNLHRGDEASLVLTGDPIDPGQVQPTTDLQAVAARASAQTPSYGRANIAAALEQVRQALTREAGVPHELYIITDRQANSWGAIDDALVDQWQRTQELFDSPLRFFVIPVGGEEADNVSVESIKVLGTPAIRDIPVQVELRIRNFGKVPRSNLPVTILSKGKQLARVPVNIAPDSAATITTRVSFSSSGSQVLIARLNGASGIRTDDQAATAINVLEPARVLIISGETKTAGERTSAELIRLALAPHSSAEDSGVDPAVVRIIGVDDWWGISPDRDDVVMLSNVGTLSDDQIRQLEQFAYAGGAIVFAPGDLIDIDNCNNDLYREGEGFLPASIRAVARDAGATTLANVDPAHPIFQFLHDRNAPLPGRPFRRFLELDDRSSDSSVIARFANDKPFLIERPYGRGRVLLFTSSLGTTWNELPLTDLYLPLLQSSIRHLAGANVPDRNLAPGTPIEMSFDHQPAQTAAIINLPSGFQRRVQMIQSGQRWTLRFNETAQPGQYIVSLGGGAGPLHYVVAAGREESDSAPVSPERWAWLQKSLNFRWLNPDKDALAGAVTAERMGKELHLPLLGAVLLLALAEMALARTWTRRA